MTRWPLPADPGAADRLIERFAALGPDEAGFAAAHAALLRGLGGGSAYLADLALREPGSLRRAVRDPGAALEAAFTALDAVPDDAPRVTVTTAMRTAKRRVALITAVADIGGAWRLGEVTLALTTLADRTLSLAVRHLLRGAHNSGDIALPDPSHPARDSGFSVLGMGKLGAGELNYSSDIDLIILFDPDKQPGRETLSVVFTRMARDLVAMMEARDSEGYVFRTDLRLRPDPAATPPAVALPAAIAYYESMGQNWERAAMIKARPVAGDLATGAGFLAAIRPFVWRRGLDFAAIADIHVMKRRIDQHRGAPAGLAGFDVKLGRGGIREIEFLAQTLQLVWGGRDPALRVQTTVGALRALARADRLPRRAAAELIVAYRALRRIEHRLQMVADRQTHTVPAKPEELARFALFMGDADTPAFFATLQHQLDIVRAQYAEVFEAVPSTPGALPLDLAGSDAPEATVLALREMGFREPAGIIAVLRGWQAGRIRALRTGRARELMDGVLPALLPTLARQSDPDAAFARFDTLLSRIPAGVELLSMLQRNPALLERIASVLGAAPSLADHLAEIPAALEGLLDPAGSDSDPAGTLRQRLGETQSLEETLAITRRMVRGEEFRLCVAQIERWIDVDAAGLARTAMAEAALRTVLSAVIRDHGARHSTVSGRPVRGGAVAIVALGKAGGREMMAGSDLDLMLVYSHPPQVMAGQWFIRAAHAFVAALTARGAEGPLYDVDMRLRPSGNKGPVAVSLGGFEQYHAESAWTWERMALTRARVVAGSPAMTRRLERAIVAALLPRPDTRADAASMRARLLRELPAAGPWDVKMRPGGGIEVEFIAQTLQLLHGMVPGGQSTRVALAGLGQRGYLPEAAALIEADRLWRTIQSVVRITVGRGATVLPVPALETLLRVLGMLDEATLHATMAARASEVRAAFIHHIGKLA